MICETCGGNRTEDHCNLCILFSAGQSQDYHNSKCWPMVSENALAVHPEQVAEANDRARRHGINVEYNEKGHCHIPDKRNYAKILRLEGFHNHAEGYHRA